MLQGLGRVLRAYVGGLSRWGWFAEEGGVWTKSLKVRIDCDHVEGRLGWGFPCVITIVEANIIHLQEVLYARVASHS